VLFCCRAVRLALVPWCPSGAPSRWQPILPPPLYVCFQMEQYRQWCKHGHGPSRHCTVARTGQVGRGTGSKARAERWWWLGWYRWNRGEAHSTVPPAPAVVEARASGSRQAQLSQLSVPLAKVDWALGVMLALLGEGGTVALPSVGGGSPVWEALGTPHCGCPQRRPGLSQKLARHVRARRKPCFVATSEGQSHRPAATSAVPRGPGCPRCRPS